ncbi:MAG: 2Fe-2S iron-sulfur cluster binding domain-containing protein [Thermodesulfobacteriota bacterium]|nr:2Fe-2S iron-sulfur cluster binding domain-containing protein [Thermodesulfobacteriota bacterium]
MAVMVEFKVSGKTVPWDGSHESLLSLAEENGVEIETECEIGVCGTCKVRLLSGTVDMEMEDGLEDEDIARGMILPCVAVPTTDVVLEV